MNISHIISKMVDEIIKWLKITYQNLIKGGIVNMNILQGKLHYYLGIRLDLSKPQKLQVIVINYIKNILEYFKQYDPTKNIVVNSAADHLFNILDNNKPLL